MKHGAVTGRRVAGDAGLVAVVVAVIVLIGWRFDIEPLKSALPGFVPMMPNTAVGFILLGAALMIAQRLPGKLQWTFACSGLAAAIAGATLLEYALDVDLSIDRGLFPQATAAWRTLHPGRMAVDTAICFVLAAGAVCMRYRQPRTRWTIFASEMLAGVVATIGPIAVVAYWQTPASPDDGIKVVSMALHTALLFTVIGGAIVIDEWSERATRPATRFTSQLWRTAACLVALIISFILYTTAENRMLRAHDSRYRSFLLADELRQSSDDLTRMVRSYVATGQPEFKQGYEDILAVRDGAKPRPATYWAAYWDLTLGGHRVPEMHGTRTVALLQLMREAGFTESEFRNLAEAKANSDALTLVERAAIQLVDAPGPNREERRAQALAMLFDEPYHRTKASVMAPIHDFYVQLEQRTTGNIRTAQKGATVFRYVFAAFGVGLVASLGRTYSALGLTLGGGVDEVHSQISRIGQGDFSCGSPLKPGRENTVLGWLAEMRSKLSETAVTRAEAAAIVASAEDAVIGKNLDGNITSWNPAAERLFGYSAQEIVGKHGSILIPEDRRDEEHKIFDRVTAGSSVNVETVRRRKDGSVVDVSISVAPIVKDAGEVVGASKIARDITARKIAERELKTLEWLLSKPGKRAMNGAPEGQPYGDLVQFNTNGLIYRSLGEKLLRDIVTDYLDLLDSSAAVYEKNGDYAAGIFSSGWCRLMDANSRKLCGTPDNKKALACGKWLCHESCWTDHSKPSIEEGRGIDSECLGGIRIYAVPIFAGKEIIGSINFGYGDPPTDPERLKELAERYQTDVAQLADAAKAYRTRPPFIIELAKRRLEASARLIGEIVSRKRAENALQESESAFRTLADAVPQMVWATRPDGWNTYFNQNWVDYTGLSLEESHGDGWSKPFHPDDRVRAQEAWRKATAGESKYSLEARLRRKDGVYRWWLVRGEPLRDQSGTIVKWFGTCTDIHDLKVAEAELRASRDNLEQRVDERTSELQSANRELEAFSYSISHDLRSPLRAIDGYSRMLVEEHNASLNDEGKRLLGVVRSETLRMATLIDELLAFSRVDRQRMQPCQIDMRALAMNALNEVQRANPKRKVRVNIPLLPTVRGEPAMLRQVWVNLLSNAMKFTRHREQAQIDIGVAQPNGEQIFYVRDNGAGFDMAHAGKLFGVFQRLHGEEEFEGNGVGLAFVKRIVQRHNGRVWAEGSPGEGATFFFSIPVASGEQQPTESA